MPKGKPITVSLIKPAIKTNKKSNLLYSLRAKKNTSINGKLKEKYSINQIIDQYQII